LPDVKAFGACLHSLKSASRTLGGDRLAGLCARSELLAAAGDQRALELLEPIVDAADEFCRALAAQIALPRLVAAPDADNTMAGGEPALPTQR
jgi:HPt (histidine-containing phosphotransfer) domain-containing protein